MKFRYLVVDDEPLARKLIVAHAQKVEGLELMAECTNAIEAGAILRSKDVDLIFLDIQMPEISGLQFIRTLKKAPAVIVTTAFRDFAPEAFEVDAIDYLLKPISFERFLQAVHKFFDRHHLGHSLMGGSPAGESFIHLKSERKTIKVPVADIRYVESLDDYVKVHTQDKVWITRENISSMEDTLAPYRFVRIHRSFLINPRCISAFSAESVFLEKLELPFGRAFKRSAMAQLEHPKS